MKLSLLFSIMFTLILIVYFRNNRIIMLEHLIDFSTELARDTITEVNDFEDMSGIAEDLLDTALKSQSELNKLMNHASDDKFASSEILTNVVSQKNQMKMLENDAMLKQLESSIQNLNDSNPSIAELVGKYGSSK